jgi:hypothetical protein
MDVRCEGPRVRGTGRAEGMLESSERFSGTSSFDGTVDGTPVREQAQTSGRWIAASCNGLPPPR